jgi:cytochrome c
MIAEDLILLGRDIMFLFVQFPVFQRHNDPSKGQELYIHQSAQCHTLKHLGTSAAARTV